MYSFVNKSGSLMANRDTVVVIVFTLEVVVVDDMVYQSKLID